MTVAGLVDHSDSRCTVESPAGDRGIAVRFLPDQIGDFLDAQRPLVEADLGDRTLEVSSGRADRSGVADADERVQMLHEFCRGFSSHLVLVGSSLGGYVSLAAAPTLHAKGVFLMAPAIYMPGIPPLKRGLPDCPIALVHGWRDEVIPYEQSMRFANENKLALHLVESDHRLHSAIPFLRHLFQYFLIESRRVLYVP